MLGRSLRGARTMRSLFSRRVLGNVLGSPGKRLEWFKGFATHQEKVPSLGDSISEGTVVEWVKQAGDYVEADEVFVVLETDKVSVDIRAQTSGVIVSTAAEEGDTVQVGADLAVIDDEGKPPASASTKKLEGQQPPSEPAPPTATTKADSSPSSSSATTPSPSPKEATRTEEVSHPLSRGERAVPMSRMRQTIAKRLKVAQNTAAMLTTFNEIDMHALMSLRAKHKDEFAEKHGVKLGFMSAFVKASSAALMKAPAVNAFFDLDNKRIVYKDYVDVSVAVATPTGLVVPVLRNTESMSMAQVEASISNFGKKARAGEISMEDMSGGTFTISNGGVYGSLMGTPILNPPQSAILGMHGIFKRPVVVDGQVVIRPMMYVALTYDHRIIDGSDGVLFLKDIKNMIEDPTRLLLEL